MNDILKVIALSVTSIVILFILTKIMGYRQMSQLSMFDYINGITIGSIAAEMATAIEDDFLMPLLAMVIYTLAAILFSKLSMKSLFLRKIFNGKSYVLYKDEILYFKNFKKTKIDFQEFLINCRCAGFFDLSDLKLAVLEPNGKISFMPASRKRALTPEDIDLIPKIESYSITIIVDGKIIDSNLKQTGNDENWVKNSLKANNIADVKDVLIATCSIDNKFKYYLANNKDTNNFV